MKMNPNARQSGFSSPVTSLGSLFPLGQVVVTANCDRTLAKDALRRLAFYSLVRHSQGDWGDIPEADEVANDEALAAGCGRLFSAYHLSQDVQIWIITEGDRSCTTILLPEDY